MVQACFVIPGDITQPTGGYGYDRRVLAIAEAHGLGLTHLPIPGGYPYPDEAVLRESARLIGDTPPDAVLLIDGLAYGAMPAPMIRAFARPVIELCHHPLALEPGVDAATAANLRNLERAAMAAARHVIVTGQQTAKTVNAEFGVDADNITVAEPGTDPAPRAHGSGSGTIQLLAVGSLIPRKGYDVLLKALGSLTRLDWQLDIVGSTTHAPATAQEVKKLIQHLKVAERVRLLGVLEAAELDQAYDRADIFVHAAHYEGYGMVIAEAMARGLPVVTTMAGAVTDTLDDRAGIKVPVNSIQVLADAIQEMIVNNEKRLIFSDGSWEAGQMLPHWNDTTAKIMSVIEKVRI